MRSRALALLVIASSFIAYDAAAACLTNADCNATPTTPICDAITHLCRACNGNADCAVTPLSPFCATTGAKAGQCVACTATADCQAPTPVCDVGSGLCKACLTSGDCKGATPICNITGGQCVACQSDFVAQNPPLFSCSNAQKPACQTSGPLSGNCTQCSATNAGQCTGATPVCVTSKGTCGCSVDTDCGAKSGLICDSAQGDSGKCITGCRVVGGQDNCVLGSKCNKNDGTIGQCVPQPCQKDSDCGGPNSGIVCDDGAKTCTPGCRGTGGNGCPGGETCSSHDGGIGQCSGGKDGGAAGDGGGSGGDGGSSGGGDGSAGGDGSGNGNGGGANGGAFDGSIVEGGGCACSSAGGASDTGALFALFGALGTLGAALRRRARGRR